MKELNYYNNKKDNIFCERVRVREKEQDKRKLYHFRRRITEREAFFVEFADEIDLFSLQKTFPGWIYEYRETILSHIIKPFRVMCQHLKDSNIKFYVKYPIEIEGKWKFADVFIPSEKLVVLLLNNKETIGMPCHSKTDREMWFLRKYKTVGVCTFEIDRTMEIVQKAIR